MTLRLLTISLLTALVVVPTAVATPEPARPAAAPPDAFERAVPSNVEWYSPDAFMRYVRNHQAAPVADHPDGFAGVAAGVPRTGGSSATVDGGSLPSPLVAVPLAGLAMLCLGLLSYRRIRRLRPMSDAAAR